MIPQNGCAEGTEDNLQLLGKVYRWKEGPASLWALSGFPPYGLWLKPRALRVNFLQTNWSKNRYPWNVKWIRNGSGKGSPGCSPEGEWRCGWKHLGPADHYLYLKGEWSEHFEQNELKEMKRLADTEKFPIASFKMSEEEKIKSVFVMLSHEPLTFGKTLGIWCQTNLVRFTLRSPGHKQ